jgi:hypothetical protein
MSKRIISGFLYYRFLVTPGTIVTRANNLYIETLPTLEGEVWHYPTLTVHAVETRVSPILSHEELKECFFRCRLVCRTLKTEIDFALGTFPVVVTLPFSVHASNPLTCSLIWDKPFYFKVPQEPFVVDLNFRGIVKSYKGG